MEFRAARHGLVEATFACERAFEGYPDVLHGGVICALLDGAMTNCLFACGVVAMTGDLRVRFRLPVATSGRAAVRAWVESSSRPLHKLAAELMQDGQIRATATAKFVERTTAARLE
jgi:acyl-coenzyme A thioesterase PaaI-like protein